MAITVAAAAVGTGVVTLTASTVESVTFTDNLGAVEIISDGTAAVWYTVDGTAPTVAGANCYYIPAVPAVDRRGLLGTDTDVVKLISSGTPSLRIQRGS